MNQISDFLKSLHKKLKTSCIFHSQDRFHLIIWISGVIVMLALTVKDFIPLMNDYKNHNLASQSIVQTEAMTPNFTICLPHHSSYFYDTYFKLLSLNESHWNGSESMRGLCDVCESMKENQWDFWNYKNRSKKLSSINLDFETTISEYFIPRLLKDGLNESMLNFDQFPWMRVVLDSLWYYFAWTSWTYVDDSQILLTEDFKISSYGSLEKLRLNKKKTPYISKSDLDRLLRYFLKGLEKSIKGGCMERRDGEMENSTTYTPIQFFNSFTIVQESICFDLPDNFKGRDFVCTYNSWPHPWQRFVVSIFEIYPNPFMLLSDVKSNQPLYSTDPSILGGQNESEYVYLKYNVESRLITKLDGEQCSDEAYPDVCVAKSQLMTAIDSCQCIPFPFRHLSIDQPLDQNLPYCNFSHYSNSSCEKKIKQNLRSSKNNCNKKCEYTMYRWTEPKIDVKTFYYNEKRPQFLLSVEFSKVPYVETTVQIKFSPVQFLCQVGGLANFYLGVSGLSLIVLIVLLIDQLKKWHWAQRTRPDKENAFDVLSFLKMVSLFHVLGTQSERPAGEAFSQPLTSRTVENNELREEIFRMKGDMQKLAQSVAKMEEYMQEFFRTVKPKEVL